MVPFSCQAVAPSSHGKCSIEALLKCSTSEPRAFIQARSKEEAHALDSLVGGPEGQPEQFEDSLLFERRAGMKIRVDKFNVTTAVGAHGA